MEAITIYLILLGLFILTFTITLGYNFVYYRKHKLEGMIPIKLESTGTSASKELDYLELTNEWYEL